MRLVRITPVLAVFALIACGDSDTDEELAGEALSMDDVVAEAQELEAMPKPGEYSNSVSLVNFDLPGLPADQLQLVQQAFSSEASKETKNCVTEEMTPEKWLSEMAESNCTVSNFDVDGSNMDATMQCNDTQGMNGTISLSGSFTETSSDFDMRFSQEIPGMGDARLHMNIKSERIGDCA